jgi:hypothetical protein
MEILNQLEKRDFQVMKFLLKSVSNDAPNDQKQNTWKTDLKNTYMKYFTKNLKKKSPLTSSSNSSKSRSY